jgi:hypothetical protein
MVYVRGFEAQLGRRPTIEVKKVMQGHLNELEDDSHLRPQHVQLQVLTEDADERVVDVPELTRAPKREGCVTCSCMA